MSAWVFKGQGGYVAVGHYVPESSTKCRWKLLSAFMLLGVSLCSFVCYQKHLHNLSKHWSTREREEGGGGAPGDGRCCGGGYVSFQRLPIHQGSGYRCAGPTSSAGENKARQQSPLSAAITHPPAGPELRVTFFPEPPRELLLLIAPCRALKTQTHGCQESGLPFFFFAVKMCLTKYFIFRRRRLEFDCIPSSLFYKCIYIYIYIYICVCVCVCGSREVWGGVTSRLFSFADSP